MKHFSLLFVNIWTFSLQQKPCLIWPCLSNMELVFFHSVWRLHLKTLHLEGNFEGQMTPTPTTSEETGHPTLHAYSMCKKKGQGQVVGLSGKIWAGLVCLYVFGMGMASWEPGNTICTLSHLLLHLSPSSTTLGQTFPTSHSGIKTPHYIF